MVDRFERAAHRRALLARAVDFKGGACEICGYDKCLASLVFHHEDPLAKDFAISEHMTSWDAILLELEKCALVCSNCHGEIHDGMHPAYLVDPDTDRSMY